MTREEAIKELSYIADEMPSMECGDWKKAIYMAIKALEQEPCDDCVSRQAVLAIAGDSCLDLDSYEDAMEFCDEIKELPPVKSQEQKWIPVSERLPKGGKMYLCCDINGFREVGYLGIKTHNWYFSDNKYMDEIIAWMPLPEPYKAESEE